MEGVEVGERSEANMVLPIVCRFCGGVNRVGVGALRRGGVTPCAACHRSMDLAAVARALPAVVRPEVGAALAPRVLSEFP